MKCCGLYILPWERKCDMAVVLHIHIHLTVPCSLPKSDAVSQASLNYKMLALLISKLYIKSNLMM